MDFAGVLVRNINYISTITFQRKGSKSTLLITVQIFNYLECVSRLIFLGGGVLNILGIILTPYVSSSTMCLKNQKPKLPLVSSIRRLFNQTDFQMMYPSEHT